MTIPDPQTFSSTFFSRVTVLSVLIPLAAMTIILTPYWSNGVQKLRMMPQRMLTFSSLKKLSPTQRYLTAPSKPKRGLVPPMLEDSIHSQRCLAQLRSKDKSIEKYIYLSALKSEDPSMFYKLCLNNMAEFTPIIYTPTVGDACLQYSHIYRRPEGLVRSAFPIIILPSRS